MIVSASLTLASLFAWLPTLLGLTALPVPELQPVVRATMVQEEMIVRVPVRRLPPPRIVWRPGREVRCVPIRAIRGAMLSSRENVDILLPQQQRVRATFAENCPALDFYGGFYLKPQDARLCAGRDIVYSRIGGSCRIEAFRQLVPRLKRQIP